MHLASSVGDYCRVQYKPGNDQTVTLDQVALHCSLYRLYFDSSNICTFNDFHTFTDITELLLDSTVATNRCQGAETNTDSHEKKILALRTIAARANSATKTFTTILAVLGVAIFAYPGAIKPAQVVNASASLQMRRYSAHLIFRTCTQVVVCRKRQPTD